MTPTEQAARWLADVPRYTPMDDVFRLPEPHIREAAAIAAIARHLAPGDDLVERATALASIIEEYTYRTSDVEAAPELLRALLARISALTATVAEVAREGKPADHALVDKYRRGGSGIFNFPDDVAAIIRKLDAAEAEAATLRDRLARMEGALRQLKDNAKGPWVPSSVVGAIVDAALTDGGSNG
jgi:hypothetical protein